jgi:uncharacterized protein (TIGR02452 family)
LFFLSPGKPPDLHGRCGVFQNDPRMVEAAFAELLSGKFAKKFNRVVFTVYDRTKQEDNLRSSAEAFLSS